MKPWLLQIDVDIGSSAVARSVIGLVLGYVTSLIVDLAILIEVCFGVSLLEFIISYETRVILLLVEHLFECDDYLFEYLQHQM